MVRRDRWAWWCHSRGMRRARQRRSWLVFVFTLGLAALFLTACKASPPEVILYGDSLSVQAQPYFNWFTAMNGQASVVDNVAAGTAPCNWLPQMLSDAGSGVMSVAVIQFSGNAFGCMSYPPGSAAYYDAYQQEVTQSVEAFSAAGVHSFLIGAPMNYGEVENSNTSWDHLNEIYAAIAASHPDVTFVNVGASVEKNSQFTWTLPCLSFESYCGPGGQNIVRAPDGGHFCPQDPNAGSACAAWNSGAIRYGMAMAQAVTNYLSSGSAPAFEGSPLPPPGTVPTIAPGETYPYQNVHDALTIVVPLTTGQSLQSLDGRYTAILQSDGNFVVYGAFRPIWSTNTSGTGADRLVLQNDGNLVLYRGTTPVWSTQTAGSPADYLALQEDGALDLYGPTGVLWASPDAEQVTSDVAGLVGTPDEAGYWLVASDGGIFAFGDARFQGSMGGSALNAPITAMASSRSTGGYWLFGSDAGVFSFNAPFFGAGGVDSDDHIVGATVDASNQGYWLVASDGEVFTFGNAHFFG